MAKSTAKSRERDRRAVVDQLRRDQQRGERRRTIAIVSACVVVGLVIVGSAAVPLLRQAQLTRGPLAEIGASASAAGCQKVTTKKATGTLQHQPEGIPLPYAEAPPAFGPHYPQPAGFEQKFYTADDRPQVASLVHNLEHGYTILWYDATVAKDDDQMAVIEAIAKKFEGEELSDKFIAAPWTKEDGKSFPKGTRIALTHWSGGGADAAETSQQLGVWRYCEEASGAAVSDFVKEYPYSDSPEPEAV